MKKVLQKGDAMRFLGKVSWPVFVAACTLSWLLCFSTPARSDIIASSAAMVNWDTLSISYSGTGYDQFHATTFCTSMAEVNVDYPYGHWYTTPTVYDSSSSGNLEAQKWYAGSSTAVNTAPLTAASTASSASDSALYVGGVASIGDPTRPGYFNSIVDGVALRSFELHLRGTGTLTISADYWLLSSIISDSVINSGSAGAQFHVWGYFQNPTSSGWVFSNLDEDILLENEIDSAVGSYSEYKKGTFSTTIPFSVLPYHAVSGRLYIGSGIHNEVSANVPEPGTMLLLGCGLIGLAGWKRKFKK